MFILIVSGGFPQKNAPLLGVFEFDQAKALQSFGHKIIFISIDLRSFRRKRKIGFYWTKKEGIQIFNCSIPLGNFPTKLLTTIGKASLLFAFSQVIKRFGKPDIIHSHFTLISNIASILKKKFDIPLVMTEHNSEVNKNEIPKELLLLGNNTYKYADTLITVSSILADNINKNWIIKPKTVFNIVDTSIFQYNIQHQHTKHTFLSIGALEHRKGFDILINAFKKANFEKDVNLIIIGDGSQKQKLQDMIDSLFLSNQIKLLGYLDRYEIIKLMNESSIFVLASRRETFGVVYIEAMASGLPVIATMCGGPEDFVNEQNGLLIPIDNEELLTDSLLKMFNEVSLYNRNEISNFAKSNFSPEQIAKQLSEIYCEIL